MGTRVLVRHVGKEVIVVPRPEGQNHKTGVVDTKSTSHYCSSLSALKQVITTEKQQHFIFVISLIKNGGLEQNQGCH